MGKRERAKKAAGFEEFWRDYPRRQGGRGSKPKAEDHWVNLSEEEKQWAKDALPLFKACPDWVKDGGRYVPMVQTYLNQKRFLDPPSAPGERTGPDPACPLCEGTGKRTQREFDGKTSKRVEVNCECVK